MTFPVAPFLFGTQYLNYFMGVHGMLYRILIFMLQKVLQSDWSAASMSAVTFCCEPFVCTLLFYKRDKYISFLFLCWGIKQIIRYLLKNKQLLLLKEF